MGDLLKEFIAGGVGGACLVLVGHPLDTIKVRIQTMEVVPGQKPPYAGTLDCAQKIVAKEGVAGLYRGMSAPLTGVTPMYALCFWGYGIGKKVFTTEDSYKNLELGRIGLAGATSAIFTTPILAPLERVKCIMQIQAAREGGVKYAGSMDCARAIYKEGGITSLNRGFMATLARDSVASFFYFSTYEYSKKLLIKDQGWNPVVGTFMSGGFAGIANWLGCLPIDTMKSKLQVAPEGTYKKGMASVAAEIMAKDGLAGFYRGIGPVMIRAFPANAATFLGYETTIKFLNRYW